MKFDFWMRWGAALDDKSFANAWVALGICPTHDGRRSLQDLKAQEWAASGITWSFPDPELPVEGSPQEWAQAWIERRPPLNQPVHLRVINASPKEIILPWYRMLSEADGDPVVSMLISAPQAQLNIQWPLRVGYLAEDTCPAPDLDTWWPSKTLARLLPLGRDNANCDLLLHKGSPELLLQKLLRSPFAFKANLVVLQSCAMGVEWGELHALLVSLLARTRASGFLLLPASIPEHEFAELINHIVEELSHAQPMDVALSIACEESKQAFLTGLTSQLAAFSIADLAERYNARLAALPEGTQIDLSGLGTPDEWRARGVEGEEVRGVLRDSGTVPGAADQRAAARSVRVRAEALDFENEIGGGTTLAEVSVAMAAALPPPEAASTRAARFLQQRSFTQLDNEFREAKEGFVADAPAMVRIRIGEREIGWDTAPTIFPVEELPQHLELWTLSVVLSEPDHLKVPLRHSIELPRDGNSSECEFLFRPLDLPRFEGRITVVHRGRVIQTAMLRAGVVSANYPATPAGAPRLEDEVMVRQRLGDLDARRKFDLALVANHDAHGRPLLTGISANATGMKDLSKMPRIAEKINNALSPVAKSVLEYSKGLDGPKGVALLIQLAQQGGHLKVILNEALLDPANNAATPQKEFIQIVSTRTDSVVPLEFIYDYTIPEDGAKVCKNWRTAVKGGKCSSTCDHSEGKIVCPMGFWGLSKVIERHEVTPGLAKDGNLLYIQSEPTRENDTLYLAGAPVFGSSARVEKSDVAKLKKTLTTHCGAAPSVAKDWHEWEELVKKLHPTLLVALTHTDRTGGEVTVEIGDKAVKTITLRNSHVFPQPSEGRQAPLVALIGCDVAGTADDDGNHVRIFRDRGAGIVIGTIATVFGEHAATVAGKLVEGMLPQNQNGPVRLGELMRQVRRDALLDGLLMPLCLVAYGDADWILARGKT